MAYCELQKSTVKSENQDVWKRKRWKRKRLGKIQLHQIG
jgi:hypothetical protein